MRKRTLGVVLLAGLAMSGAGAFTGSNSMPAGSDSVKAGYGAVSATGVTITDTDYVFNATNDKMDKINFATSTDMTGLTAVLTLTRPDDVATAAVDESASPVATKTCTSTLGVLPGLTIPTGGYNIVCDLDPDVSLTGFETVGLTVHSSSV